MSVTTKTMNEELAKKDWLSRLDKPTWGNGVVTPVASSTASVATTNAKAMSEDEAKRAWLARLDKPTWGKAADVFAEIAKEAMVIEKKGEAASSVATTNTKAMSEDEAKSAWLARLDAPAWGAVAAAVAAVSTEIGQGVTRDKKTEDEAKKAWLARLDAPAWGQAAKMMAEVVQEATAMQEMAEACDQGDDVECELLSREEEAKKAWLARLDVPMWGAAAAAVSAVATKVQGA